MRPVIRTASACLQCRRVLARTTPRSFHSSAQFLKDGGDGISTVPSRPPTAPRVNVDIKHIRKNPELHEQNCIERNYKALSKYPARINELFAEWQARERDGRGLREQSNLLRRQITNPASIQHEGDEAPSAEAAAAAASMTKEKLLAEARAVKEQLSVIEADEKRLQKEMEGLAELLPNLTSEHSPRGREPRVLTYINDHPEPEGAASDRVWRSHAHIGTELGIMDFTAGATASGWGWYYLLDQGAQLEQALIQYALAVVTRDYGWRQVSPPSIVYSHIGAACGFQPRDQNGETQVYTLAQSAADAGRKPQLSLAGTAEIPLAGMKADTTIEEAELPLRRVAVSRCYRAEAGARGAETKGLYRVHEFNKVEMFAWTAPDADGAAAAADVFDEMVDIQTDILSSLGLHCRVLEMPTADLGASASRKIDIEAFFPSRKHLRGSTGGSGGGGGGGGGWGEVTSASVCTDYQARRLATRLRRDAANGGNLTYPYTLNGTALAVPRVLAAVLENGWDEADQSVAIPECLRPWMDGRDKITKQK